MSSPSRRRWILEEIVAQRGWQERHASGFRFSCADADIAMETKLPVLVEAVGEVGRAVAELDEINLRAELVQVAAVALAWLESLPDD